jgi:hypothetical protein
MKLRVWGYFVPNFVRILIRPQKGTSYAEARDFFHQPRNQSVGSGWARISEKFNKNKKLGQQRYTSRMRRCETSARSLMTFSKFVEPQDLKNHYKFHPIWWIVCKLESQKWGFPFDLHLALTTLPCATALASDYKFNTDANTGSNGVEVQFM